MRGLPVSPTACVEAAINALQGWLEWGAGIRAKQKPSPWYLAQKAVLLIDPPNHRGPLIWTPEGVIPAHE